MLISRKILQSYFNEPLPDSETIANELTLKSYEVESIEQVGQDEVFDIDVLPNRASDSLSHIGVAREVGLVFGLEPNFSLEKVVLEEFNPDAIEVTVEDDSTKRFIAVSITLGSAATETPVFIKKALEVLGERSISPIVDVTNYVMLTTGQPLHAYDLDVVESISGKARLSSGMAKEGEKLILLDGTEVTLTGEELIIRSKDNVLGLAGVKGGLESGVSEKTSRILLEAACFDPKLVRRTAKITKIQTGASKRFENGVPADLAALGIKEALALLGQVYQNMEVVALRDDYPIPVIEEKITLAKNHPERLLGVNIEYVRIQQILEGVGAEVKDIDEEFLVTTPWYRPDLRIPVDLIEEVGRLYGLTKVKSSEMEPKAVTPERSTISKEVIRDLLTSRAYSEIITRAFQKNGEVELANPLATDAPFLRSEMMSSIKDSLDLASRNAELLEIGYARLFEIGTVFTKDSEEQHLTIGIQKTKNAQKKIDLASEIGNIETELNTVFGIDISEAKLGEKNEGSSLVVEYDLDQIVEGIDLMPHWEYQGSEFLSYKEFSHFPYVLRDLAVWTPEGTTAEDVETIIRDRASDLLRVVTLFDRFEKNVEGNIRTSYAFRLVFQSFDKTLSDEEVNTKMELVYSALSEMPGYEIR